MCGLEWIYLSEYFVKYSNTVSAFAVVQLLSLICLLVTPWTTARQSPLSSTISQSLLNSCVELAMLSNHLILCHPLLLLPSAFPSIIVYSNLLALFIKWPKVVLELQLQQQSVQWIFRVNFLSDWLVWSPCSPEDSQESSPAPQFEASILWRLAFFMVQLSHPYMTTRKTIALTLWSFVGKVMSLLFKILSSFVITFLLRSKCLWISWLQSPSAVILGPRR